MFVLVCMCLLACVFVCMCDVMYSEHCRCFLTEVKIVQQMPTYIQGSKPTVAIITSKYYEKLAVDAMMEQKTTFVKYKTEGIRLSMYH